MDLRVACRCGKVQARLCGITPRVGNRVVCHCIDCQTFARALGGDGVMDANCGTEIYQTLPGRLEIQSGSENVVCLRLSPDGLMRWYSACCYTPLGNTLDNTKFLFVGIPLVAFPKPDARDAMGPQLGSFASDEAPDETAPPADFGLKAVIARNVRRNLLSRLFLAPRGTPFFNDGEPIAVPRVLTEAERNTAAQPTKGAI